MKENNASLSSVILRLFSYLWTSEWQYRSRILISLCLTLIVMVFRLGIPFILKSVINMLSEPTSFAPVTVSIILVGYGTCWILEHIITQFRTFFIFKVFERGMRLLSLSVVEHLLSLTLRFHLDRRTGALTNYIHRMQNGFETAFWGLFSFLIPTCIEMIFVTVLISSMFGLSYSQPLFLIAGGYVLLNYYGMHHFIAVQHSHNENRASASARIVDSLLNFETMKYFTNEKLELEHVNTALKAQEISGLRRSKIDFYFQLAQSILIGLGFAYLTWRSGLAVARGQISLGDFVLINGLMMQFIIPLYHLGNLFFQIRKGLYDIQSTIDILFLKSEIQDIPQAETIQSNNIEVAFEHVHFGYHSDRTIIKDLSLIVPKGKTIAIVGSTGSGKSTIARLIFRFYDIESGCIKINGQDIRHLSQHSLHEAIGIVPQDTILFNETLFYNIAYGNHLATKSEVEKAVSLAQLDSFIQSLPAGFDTIVGERGLKLSGGEKQRIAIARVLLKKPKLFIFDEATSSLDTLTEREIQKNLYQISSGVTTIIIAHRLSTVTQADEIHVLENGIMVESGRHQELLIKKGIYAKMWQEQAAPNQVKRFSECHNSTELSLGQPAQL